MLCALYVVVIVVLRCFVSWMVGVVLVFSDVTEQYRVQVALQESEDRYRTVVELIPEAIAVHRGAKVIYVNPAAIRMFGASSPQDLVGKSILDMVHPRLILANTCWWWALAHRVCRPPTTCAVWAMRSRSWKRAP